jgi:hypothetical protein
MPFEARVYIQGVGVYVPQENGELHVLFPNQEKAAERKLHEHKGIPVCRHHAVVQFDTRSLASGPHPGPTIPWTTLDITGLWVRLSAEPTPVKTRLTENGRVPGVPHLPDILKDLDPSLDQNAKPVFSSEAEWLRAGLELKAGILSPYAEYEGLFDFDVAQVSRRPKDRRYSSVLKLELGEVESFALTFRPFGSQKESTLHLSTPWDELDVWIRHFCDLERPDPDLDLPSAGEDDTDFVLNYAFLNNLDAVLKACDNVLPVPRVASSWARGGHIGLESRKCMAVSA